tara:strand:+ start:569 stop:916 length:348 start_codon:yes stop_codon:yes gene_type:complete
MNRPYSPTTVMTSCRTPLPSIISSLIDIDDFHYASDQGLTYVKNKLNKHSVNAGEIMLQFYNCDSVELELQTKLFCITVLVLVNQKNNLNEINDEIYDKLMNYTVNKYSTFLETI